MAIDIFTLYGPLRAGAPTVDYPVGFIKNESTPGANDGTPLDQQWANDYAGFDAALFAETNVTPSGNPDTSQASQRLDALLLLIKKISGQQFGSVNEMKLSSPEIGQKISTNGYDVSDGVGASEYITVNSFSADGFGDHVLSNGYVAKLLVKEQIFAESFGIFGDSSDNTDALNALVDRNVAFNLPFGEITTNATITPGENNIQMSGRGRYVVGDGNAPDLLQTTLISTSAPTGIEIKHAIDRQTTPCSLANFMIEGNGSAGSIGIDQQFRHQTNKRDLYIRNFDIGMKCTDTWLDNAERIRIYEGRTAMLLEGSNHASLYQRISMIGQTGGTSLIVNNNGSAVDSSSALVFDNIDIEFGGANQNCVEVNVPSKVKFRDSYIGEQMSGHTYTALDGTIVVEGGIHWFANEGGKKLARANGGNIDFFNADIIGGTFASYQTLAEGTTGKVKLVDCRAGFDQSFNFVNGLYLADHPGHSYCPPNGYDWAVGGTAGRTLSSDEGFDLKITCTSAGSLLYTSEVKDNIRWLTKQWLVIEYAANTDTELKLVQSTSSDNPIDHTIVILPQNGGIMSTAVMCVGDWPGSGNLRFFKIQKNNMQSGEFFQLRRIAISDERMGGDEDGFVKNVYFPS